LGGDIIYNRRKSRVVRVGGVLVGGDNPIVVESMTSTDTRDANATAEQIKRLTQAGCEIVRLAVPDEAAARAFGDVKKRISIPLIADIHFDYKLALLALENGADKLRINPGNIGGEGRVSQLAAAAKGRGVPIRVGVNAGSLERDIFNKYGGITAKGMAESALNHVQMLERCGFEDIVVGMKANSIPLTIAAHQLIVEKIPYPLHIGITEAGLGLAGMVKSAAGLAGLLTRGWGDTLRVSLTGDPVAEVTLARELLQSLNLRHFKPEIVSCPTCGRCRVDLEKIANEVEKHLQKIEKYVKVAVMGCEVNGPGEARDADVGLACGSGAGLIFRNGEVIRKVSEDEMVAKFMEEIYIFLEDSDGKSVV